MYRPIIVAWHSLPYWCLRRLQRTHHHGPVAVKGTTGKNTASSGLLEERRAGVLMEAFSRVSRLPALKNPRPNIGC